MRRSSAETRELVLRVAGDLFYWDGIHATGIDKVAAEAGVAPTTLYRLFSSKDDLVAAYVEHNADGYRAWFTAASNDDGRTAADRILAVFDALSDQVRPDVCRGCPFLMTLSEFPGATSSAHQGAVALKKWVREQFRNLAREHATAVEVEDPEALGDQLALVMEGVYASVQALGVDGPAAQARVVARTLLGITGDR